jgi:signal transduction histidine kinase
LKLRIFLKVLGTFLVVILTVTVVIDFAVRPQWQSSILAETRAGLLQKTQMFAARLIAAPDSADVKALAQEQAVLAHARATIIDQSGEVLADTESDPQLMENHSARPEFQAALHGQVLVVQRFSHTRGMEYLYAAAPSNRGAVRLAYPLEELARTAAQVRRKLLLASLLAVVIATIIAALFAQIGALRLKRILDFAEQVASGDLSARLPVTQDELGQLAKALNRTAGTLEETFSELRRMEQSRRDFMANVSHELRTPLTAIQGFTETLLEDEYTPEQRREFLSIIQRNSLQMSRLTADVLQLAKVEHGEIQFQFGPVSAAQLVHRAASEWQEAAAAKGATIVTEQIAPRSVLADEAAIMQVFANLIENALKYGAPATRVEIGAKERAEGVEFFVRDFGEGIPKEHHARLFERFYRVDKARSREAGGTGLGLAIVKHIVLSHCGSVRVESSSGAGSTFAFTLPYAFAASAG